MREMEIKTIINKLEALGDPLSVEGMERFGIKTVNAYGVSIPNLRKMAKEIRKNNELALKLWEMDIHEAKLLAAMIADPKLTTEAQMESWVNEFYSWDICDQCILNLFEKTKYAYLKAVEWSEREEEFVKRAGFVLMARLAVSDKKAEDKEFEQFFPIIIRHATDNRNFVKKAVNWAIRQIGKRNVRLNIKTIELAEEIQKINTKSAKWIANDALRELKSECIQKRLRNQENKKG